MSSPTRSGPASSALRTPGAAKGIIPSGRRDHWLSLLLRGSCAQTLRSECAGQERVERGIEAGRRITNRDHSRVGPEFVDDLATRATGGGGGLGWGVDQDGR